MFRKIRIAPRMALMIIVGAGGILGAVIGYNYIFARGLLLEELRQKSNHLAQATACRIEVTGYAVEKVVQSAAFMLTENARDVAQQYDLLEKTGCGQSGDIRRGYCALAAKRGTLCMARRTGRRRSFCTVI
jgi:phosphoserine phosphatase RsbU/P